MKCVAWLVLVGFMSKPLLFAQDPQVVTRAEVHVSKSGGELRYRSYAPERLEAGKTYPLVLFLHGAGERGDDNAKQLHNGIREFLAYQAREPFFMLIPQCPVDEKWVDLPFSKVSYSMPAQPSRPMGLVLELLSARATEWPVDRSRIYVVGLSMGGFGSWDAIERHPEWFAAAVPICGGGDVTLAAKIKDIPIWAFHGEKDDQVSVQCSRDMIDALRKAGGNPKYTEYEGVGHDAWSATFKNPEVFDWLFAQKRRSK